MKTKKLYLSDNQLDRLFRKASNKLMINFEESSWVIMQNKIDNFLMENK